MAHSTRVRALEITPDKCCSMAFDWPTDVLIGYGFRTLTTHITLRAQTIAQSFHYGRELVKN